LRPIRSHEDFYRFQWGFHDGNRRRRLTPLNLESAPAQQFHYDEMYAWGFTSGAKSDAPYEELAAACLSAYSRFMGVSVIHDLIFRPAKVEASMRA
jgi:hypothetical protein